MSESHFYDEEDLNLFSHLLMGAMVAAVTVVVVGVAVAWHAISLTSEAIQTMRRKAATP